MNYLLNANQYSFNLRAMKKMLLTIGMCFFVLGLIAQEEKSIYLSDQQVVPPQFNEIEVEEVKERSPICCFLENNLEIDMPATSNYTPEGTVAIEFTVNKDGTLSNFVVVNHVDDYLNQAVIDCIKETEGKWRPGEVNGTPSAMEKRVYVRFDIPDNPPFEELARQNYQYALKRYHKGENIQSNKMLSSKKQTRKSHRMFNRSLNQLDAATVYMPNDATLAFWKAKNYEKLGMHKEMIDMLELRQTLLSMDLSEQELDKFYDLAVITLD
ncbi:energy transducer TonB family protein [Carboxylicivirga sp. RSCT41]|uniref:energy transducer TonB family protein n=1 Tax=Carboxylicivirga agarovorans TaxID=3417570 RepID=UPI003D33AA72